MIQKLLCLFGWHPVPSVEEVGAVFFLGSPPFANRLRCKVCGRDWLKQVETKARSEAVKP